MSLIAAFIINNLVDCFDNCILKNPLIDGSDVALQFGGSSLLMQYQTIGLPFDCSNGACKVFAVDNDL